jgi:hypothetical protein
MHPRKAQQAPEEFQRCLFSEKKCNRWTVQRLCLHRRCRLPLCRRPLRSNWDLQCCFFPRESLVQVYIFRFDSHLWNGEETFTTSSKDYPLGGILPRGKFPQNSDPRQGPLYLARRNTKHCVCQWVKKYRLLMNSYIVRIMRYLQTFVSSTLNVFSFNVQVDTNYLMPPFFEDSRIWHLLTLVINWHRFDTYCCHLHVKWKNVNE